MYETVPEMPDVPYTPSKAGGDPSKNWMAFVSLILSILNLCSICSFFFPEVGIFICCFSMFLSLGAVVFGILGLKSTKRTLAIIGLVLGGLGLFLQLISAAIGLLGRNDWIGSLQSLLDQLGFVDSAY